MGQVVDVRVVYEADTFKMRVAALIDFEPKRILEITDDRQVEDTGEEIDTLIARGLRAQLATRSVVTGQQAVQLVFQPDTEAVLVGLLPHDEIPTIPGGLGQIQQALETEVWPMRCPICGWKKG